MPLKKFEKWVLAENLRPKQFIFPVDRILYKLGYKGPPLIFRSYFKVAFLLSLFWFIGVPTAFILGFGLILQDHTWINSLREDAVPLSLLLLGTSIFFGFIAAYFIKRTAEKTSLPHWDDFLDK